MHTLEPRVQVGPWLTAPDEGERPALWVLFSVDGDIIGVWRTLDRAEAELAGVAYVVSIDDYARPVAPPWPVRALRYLTSRIITAIR